MGKLTVTVAVGDQQGRRFTALDLIVDTGSTFTALPRSLLESLDVPVARQARSRMADGRTTLVDVGWTMIRLQEQEFPTRITFAEDNEPALLGVVTLEEALLAVDPVGQRLIPVDADRLHAGR